MGFEESLEKKFGTKRERSGIRANCRLDMNDGTQGESYERDWRRCGSPTDRRGKRQPTPQRQGGASSSTQEQKILEPKKKRPTRKREKSTSIRKY